MQKLVDNALWILSLLFIIPTIFIMASWNSYPGEPMYGVKLALEKTLLFFVKPSYTAEASLNVVYTERRFTEAKTLLANDQSASGLSYLSQQITSTTAVIDRAPNQETKKKIATEYVAKLKEVNSTLEEQKQIVISNTPSSFASPVPTKPSASRVASTAIPTTKPMTGGVIAATPTTKPAATVIAATPTTKPAATVIAATPTTKPAAIVIAATPTVIPRNDLINLNSQGSLQLKSAQITQAQQIIQQNIDELETILKEPDKKEDKKDDKKEDKKNEVNQNNSNDNNNRDGGNDRKNDVDGRD